MVPWFTAVTLSAGGLRHAVGIIPEEDPPLLAPPEDTPPEDPPPEEDPTMTLLPVEFPELPAEADTPLLPPADEEMPALDPALDPPLPRLLLADTPEEPAAWDVPPVDEADDDDDDEVLSSPVVRGHAVIHKQAGRDNTAARRRIMERPPENHWTCGHTPPGSAVVVCHGARTHSSAGRSHNAGTPSQATFRYRGAALP